MSGRQKENRAAGNNGGKQVINGIQQTLGVVETLLCVSKFMQIKEYHKSCKFPCHVFAFPCLSPQQ